MSEQLPVDARVFAVASGKGGVGKTTTAVTVGAALAASGAETVVVDADLGMANVADLLDLSVSGPTLQDVLAGELAVEKATYRTHEGMAVVPGATALDSYAEVDPERLRTVVERLRAEFEYVFLDAGAGLSYDTALPLGLSDAVVLVTTPRETAARDAGKTRELAERIDAAVAGVVVTRVREEPSELGPDTVAERVGAPVLAAVPEDAAVREALSAGRPVVTHAPESLVTAAYRRLAAALTGNEAVEPVAASAGSADADDPTSLAELLERESDHPADVSALTGDSAADPGPAPDAVDESTPDAVDESTPDADGPTPDDAPALELEGGDRPDPLAADPEPSDDHGEDSPTLDLGGDLADGTDAADEPAEDRAGEPEMDAAADEDSDTGIDGDVALVEDASTDAGGAEPGDEPFDGDEESGDGPSGDEPSGGDPMADIPRFEDESDEEFTRSTETADPLAADPLEADPGDDAVAPTGEDAVADDASDATDPGDAEIDPTDEGDATDASDATDEDGAGETDEASEEGEADEDDADEGDADDEKPVGPHVEGADPEDDAGGKGLFGRLAGLFR